MRMIGYVSYVHTYVYMFLICELIGLLKYYLIDLLFMKSPTNFIGTLTKLKNNSESER